MGLIARLKHGPVALDTAIFIYLIEEHPDLLPVIRPVFAAIDQGDLKAVTSAVTLLETLVIPYRNGDVALAEQYENLLTRSRGLQLIAIDAALLRAAAFLRARFGLRTPDALQLAAALETRCTVFLTNDRRLPAIPGLDILQVGPFAR